jgi:hypothetical protein
MNCILSLGWELGIEDISQSMQLLHQKEKKSISPEPERIISRSQLLENGIYSNKNNIAE